MSKRKAEEQNGSPAEKTSLEDFTSVFDGCVCVCGVDMFRYDRSGALVVEVLCAYACGFVEVSPCTDFLMLT